MDIKLIAEWIDYMNAYRLYDSRFPQQSVAYVDTFEEAFRSGYEIVIKEGDDDGK